MVTHNVLVKGLDLENESIAFCIHFKRSCITYNYALDHTPSSITSPKLNIEINISDFIVTITKKV